MSTQLKLRRGTTAQHSSFTGAQGEITVDTTKNTIVVHDGVTAGGKPLATEALVATVVPTQTGNSGKYLTTNGSSTSWATVDALPTQTGNTGKFLTTNGSAASWATLNTDQNVTTKGLYENNASISVSYTIGTGNNAMSAGPITVAAGATVTVPSGSRWVII